MVEIRKANKEDAEKIAELIKKNTDYHAKIVNLLKLKKSSQIKENWKKDVLDSIKSPKSRIYVALMDGKIVGFAEGEVKKGHKYMKYKKTASLNDMYVEKGHRGHKIGKKLVDSLIDWFKTRGAEKAGLSVNSENEKTVDFYKKYGFKEAVKQMTMDLK